MTTICKTYTRNYENGQSIVIEQRLEKGETTPFYSAYLYNGNGYGKTLCARRYSKPRFEGLEKSLN